MSVAVELARILPRDASRATLVGRVFDPSLGGPTVVAVRGNQLIDLSEHAATVSQLLETPGYLEIVRTARSGMVWDLREVWSDTHAHREEQRRMLAPIDLQVIKAAGVTFVSSMLERVIEERAVGDPAAAEKARTMLAEVIGGAIDGLVPGSAQAQEVKALLISEGLWSQYLEVGIGPDPEIFTKAPVLSAVGVGAKVGVLARSTWNNPEPELVLVTDAKGAPLGATLGNDVNLRDFEGRSALLLGEAKDNNASCSIGPFLRLFDDDYTIDDARRTSIDLHVYSDDGFSMFGSSSVAKISRPFEELLAAARGRHHQYPDGMALFTGTLFSPTTDRDESGMGFTHHEGDTVEISSERLGLLINTVTTAEKAPEWTFGISRLMTNLAQRGLLCASVTR